MCDVRELATRWTLDPLVLGTVGLSSAVYARGVARLRRARDGGPANAGPRPWQIAAFALGQLSILVALVSPLDTLSDWLFSAHMTQHEILMVVAAPILVVGKPLVTSLWALPHDARTKTAHFVGKPGVRRTWRIMTDPLLTLMVHGAVVWMWHLPSLFEAAMQNEWIHGVQHFTFFVTAALFWWGIVHGRYGKSGYGLAVLFVFATAMHTSLLGALLGLGTHVLYPTYAARVPEVGMDPLVDQGVAGFIMWIPVGVLLTLIALGLFAAWLGEAERARTRAQRSRAAHALKEVTS